MRSWCNIRRRWAWCDCERRRVEQHQTWLEHKPLRLRVVPLWSIVWLRSIDDQPPREIRRSTGRFAVNAERGSTGHKRRSSAERTGARTGGRAPSLPRRDPSRLSSAIVQINSTDSTSFFIYTVYTSNVGRGLFSSRWGKHSKISTTPTFPKIFFMDFCFDRLYECANKIWTP